MTEMFGDSLEAPSSDLVHPFPSYDSQVVSERRASNSKQAVNRLPPELLSRIFMMGEEERVARPRKIFYLGLQDLATHVCSHWRDVAISNPALWTYIHITRPPPNRLANLYLDRAGPTVLLDINIETRSRYWDRTNVGINNWMSQVNSVSHLLKCLISYGAGVNRWKSLAICAKRPEVLFYILGFLNGHCASSLRSLSLEWKASTPVYSEEVSSLGCPGLFTDSHTLSGSVLPGIRAVEFIRIPWGFVLDRRLPLLTGLTALSLTSSSELSSLSQLRELLSANCSLESLHLNAGLALGAKSSTMPKPQSIQLLSLRLLSLESPIDPKWVLDVVQMIEAPALEKFTLSTIAQSGDPQDKSVADVLKYISTGKLPDHIESASAPSTSEPIYPSLQELDISSIDSPDEPVAEMLSSFPSATRLSVSGPQGDLLSRTPWLLPNLISLRFPRLVHPRLGDILRCRAEAGCPIQVVELPKSWRYEVEAQVPSTVVVARHRDIELGLDYDASRDECYGWDLEDEDICYGNSKDEWLEDTGTDYSDEDEVEW